jgi:hypothetical protein
VPGGLGETLDPPLSAEILQKPQPLLRLCQVRGPRSLVATLILLDT